MSCDEISELTEKEKEKTVENCPYKFFANLPTVEPADLDSRCFVNGRKMLPGDTTTELDNCNYASCSLDDNNHAELDLTLMACEKMTKYCGYEAWFISNCFKFINSEGRNCFCNNGDIECI